MENSRYSFDIADSDFKQSKPKNKNGGCSRTRIILAVVFAVTLVVVIIIVLALVSWGSEDKHLKLCPAFQNTSSNTPPGTGSNGTTWRSRTCALPSTLTCPDGFDSAPTLLISLDGFRQEYLDRGLTPNLERLRTCGTQAKYMRPAFPSKTFPNHYAIVTGLYPESHGIIDNWMYDKTFKDVFTLSGPGVTEGRWWNGEPIWNSAMKKGKIAGTFFWPGSEADIQGMRPDYCYDFDKSVPFEWRVDGVLAWLDLPADERPELLTVYFNQPDSAGHEYGPESEGVNSNLTKVDDIIGMLMDGLTDRGLEHCINIVVVSDHGMAPIDCSEMINLSDKIDRDTHFIYTGTVGRVTGDYVWGPDGNIIEQDDGDSAAEVLSKLECRNYNTTSEWYSRAYLKQGLPKRFHYAVSPRIEDVIVITEDERLVTTDYTKKSDCRLGDHGFDNTLEDMKAIFMAYGPSIKQRTMIEEFENIEVYDFLTDLISVPRAPTNGTYGRLHVALADPPLYPDPDPSQKDYAHCAVPRDKDTRDQRRAAVECHCTDWKNITNLTEDQADQRLQLSAEVRADALERHLPTGVPSLQMVDEVCEMVQQDYVNGYSRELHMPLWVAYSLQSATMGTFDSGEQDCVRPDVRLSENEAVNCNHYIDSTEDITWSYLFPPGYSNDSDIRLEGYLATNIVPMYSSFKQGVWQNSQILIEEYAREHGEIQVLSGPIFDFNYDGHRDPTDHLKRYVASGPIPLPTHYYHTLTRCPAGGSLGTCSSPLETMSMVLPHQPDMGNCWDNRVDGYFNYFQDNVARARDVEELAALGLFSKVSNQVRVMLRTSLAIGLWARTQWIHSEMCPDLDNPQCPTDVSTPPVLLVSLDGFRADYLQRGLTPTLSRMAECGVSTDYMRSIYPSLTFPNHYSLATGLYPESHGIVDNSMYDLPLNESFYLGSDTSTNPAWWYGEPIWNTAIKQNKTAMTYFWPGSDVAIQGMRPTRYYDYNGDTPYGERVDQVIRWLSGSEGFTPNLVVMYMEKVDKAGHEGGPDSRVVNESLSIIDGYISQLMDGLKRAGLDSCVDILITADHGMSDLSCDRSVLIRDHLDTLYGLYMYPGTAARLANTYYRSGNYYYAIKEEDQVSIDEVVEKLSCADPQMNVYPTSAMPAHFHYANHPRVEQIQLVLADTWQADRYSPWCPILGQHGWDPSFDTMKALFIAYGPSFESSLRVEPFENIELYNLLADMLGVVPVDNNGTAGSLNHLLRTPPSPPAQPTFADYLEWNFPTQEEYERRVAADQCTLTCNRDEADQRLNMSATERHDLELHHLPWGPLGLPTGVNVTLLQQQDYLLAYSEDLLLPLYVAFTAERDTLNASEVESTDCRRQDVRLDDTVQHECSDFGTLSADTHPQSLFPIGFCSSDEASTDAALMTNTVPMLGGFYQGIWKSLANVLKEFVIMQEHVHVTMGTVFDYDVDGRADDIQDIMERFDDGPYVPSHYYMTAMYCLSGSNCSVQDYEVFSTLLPHTENITNCMTLDAYIFDNRVRMRDIELLTGLQFFGTVDKPEEATHLRIRLPENKLLLDAS